MCGLNSLGDSVKLSTSALPATTCPQRCSARLTLALVWNLGVLVCGIQHDGKTTSKSGLALNGISYYEKLRTVRSGGSWL